MNVEEETAEDEPEETTQTAVLQEGDPLDEDVHRDRLDGAGDLLVRRETDGLWIWPDFSKYGTTLREADTHEGPLTFAPQPERADPLDENDHRPRLTSGGAVLTRRDCGTWHNFGLGNNDCPNPRGSARQPLRSFARTRQGQAHTSSHGRHHRVVP